MALHANELRIGNTVYVSLKSGNGRTVVRNIEFDDIIRIVNNSGSLNYEPIPLTAEWLLNFGFLLIHKNNQHYIINDPNGYKDSYKISIFPTLNNQWRIAFCDNLNGYKDYIPTTKISYVHQLQNLYFALTNEELTFNQ